MPQASRAEKDGLGWTGVKKRRREGDKNGNLFERSEFISVQPDRRSFSPFRRSLDFSFCELYLFIKEKKKWTPTLGERKKVDPPTFGKEREKYYTSIRENETLNLNSTTPVAPLRHFAKCISPTRLGADANNLSGRCTNSTISAAAS